MSSTRSVLWLLLFGYCTFSGYGLDTSTHAGVKIQFGLKFIKEQKVDMKWGDCCSFV